VELLIEVACDSDAAASGAVREGAARLEICARLDVGGLTPSPALVRAAAGCDVPVLAMVRPHANGFVYGASELKAMAVSIAPLLDAGAEGIVFGCLTPGGDVDVEAAQRLIGAASGAVMVFHRAFDAVRDGAAALETLIGLGVSRVLTGGLAPAAIDGVERLRALRRQGEGRIEILPGGGIRAGNVERIVRESGCRQVHCAYAPGRVAALAARAALIPFFDESR